MPYLPLHMSIDDNLEYIGSWGSLHYNPRRGGGLACSPEKFMEEWNRIMNPATNKEGIPRGTNNQIIMFPSCFVTKNIKDNDLEILYNVEKIYHNYP